MHNPPWGLPTVTASASLRERAAQQQGRKEGQFASQGLFWRAAAHEAIIKILGFPSAPNEENLLFSESCCTLIKFLQNFICHNIIHVPGFKFCYLKLASNNSNLLNLEG